MIKKINIILVLLLLFISISAVSAADDLNDTVASSDETVDLSTSDISDAISDDEVLTSTSHTVNSSNYNTYFNAKGKLNSQSVNDGDTINIDGDFSGKNFTFEKQVNVVGTSSNNLKNCVFTFKSKASNSTISNLNIANTANYHYGIFLNGASNCLITGCTIKNTGQSSYAVCVANNANYNNVTNNKLTCYGITYGHGTRSTTPLLISGAHYNYVAGNDILCDDANGIYLSTYSGGPLNGGNSNFNIIYNNTIRYNVLPTSWSYGIQFMGLNNTANSNTIIGAYIGVSTSGAGSVIINNRIINLTGADFNNPGAETGGQLAIAASSHAVIVNNTIENCKVESTGAGISALDYSIIENNNVQIVSSKGTGILPKGSYIVIRNNNISTVSGSGVLYNTYSFNLTVANNNIFAKSGVGVLIQKVSNKKMPGNLTIINNYIVTDNKYAIDAREASSTTVNDISNNTGKGIIATPEGEYDASKPAYNFNGTTHIVNSTNYDEFVSANGYLSADVKDGDILYFEGEFSNKTIFINKAVKITGKDPKFYNVKFKVYTNAVWIENLTIKNDKVANGWGVLVYRAFGVTIRNCDIDVYDKNAAYAIYVIESSDVDIINNKLSSSGNYLTYTIIAHTVEDCRFINNTIFTNGTSELYINGGEVCTAGNETCTAGNEVCTAGNEVCTTGGEVCTTGGEVCTTGGEVCTAGDETCTSGNEVCTTGNSVEGVYVLQEVYRTYGILMVYSSNNIVSGNNVTVTSKLNQTYPPTNSTNSLVGIDLYYNTHNNMISNNNVYVYGYDNYIYGVGVLGSVTGHPAPEGEGASDNQFINNNIVLDGSYCVEGIIIGYASENTTITGNTVNAYADCIIYGVTLEMSQKSIIKKNNFALNSEIIYGIEVYASNDNIINNNGLQMDAKQVFGLILDNAKDNEINSNIIFANSTGEEITYKNFDSLGTGSAGVYLRTNSSNNNIKENEITSKVGYAVLVDEIAINNTISNNCLVSKEGIGNAAVSNAINNTVENNYAYFVTGELADITIKYLENATFKFTTTDENLEGATVEFYALNDKIGSTSIGNGSAVLVCSMNGFTPSSYSVSAVVSKENFKTTEFESALTVEKGNLIVSVDNVTGAIGRNAQFNATLRDILGNPVSGISVEFSIIDEGYPAYLGKAVSGSDGVATLDAEIPQIYGDNPLILAEVKESDNFEATNASANLNAYKLISTSININSNVYPGGVLAVLKDQNGKGIANKKVVVKVGSTSYNVTSSSKGEITLPSVTRGSYNVYVSFAGDKDYYSSNGNKKITVKPAITGNKDKSVYYGNTITYKVRIVGTDGKYVGKGKVVKVNVNGHAYSLKTDKNGYASKSLKLNAGKYTITAQYNGDKVSNKLTFKNTVITKNISKKKAKTIKFSAKLVNKNGKILKNKKITFKIKGKTYKVKTNKKGVATVSLKNLKVGKHTITSSYGGCKVSNTITVKK